MRRCPTYAWAVGGGTGGQVLTNDGAAWSVETLSSVSHIREVWGAALNDIFAPATTTDFVHFDGATWTTVSHGVPTSSALSDVWGSSASEVFMVGGGGTVLRGTP